MVAFRPLSVTDDSLSNHPVSSQQHTYRERRVVLLFSSPFNDAAAPDFTRVPHANALHYGARTHVVADGAGDHGLHAEDIEGECQPGVTDFSRVAAPPEVTP